MRTLAYINFSFWSVVGIVAYIDRATIGVTATRFIITTFVLSIGLAAIVSALDHRKRDRATLRQPALCFWPPNPEDIPIRIPTEDFETMWKAMPRIRSTTFHQTFIDFRAMAREAVAKRFETRKG